MDFVESCGEGEGEGERADLMLAEESCTSE